MWGAISNLRQHGRLLSISATHGRTKASILRQACARVFFYRNPQLCRSPLGTDKNTTTVRPEMVALSAGDSMYVTQDYDCCEHNNFRLPKEGCQRDHEAGLTLAKQYGEFSGITRQDNKQGVRVPECYKSVVL
jgi:hypothetical protein